MRAEKFRTLVWRYYRTHGRHDLPWRPPALKLRRDKTLDPYRVLVAEIMLQQTQVERVVPFYKKFIKKFPTAKKLAAAPLSEVLKSWQGLGYNRRAKMLHEAASQFPRFHILSYSTKYGMSDYGESDMVRELEKLPGVGPYIARAIASFAWNAEVAFVETNIRTAIIHHFFNKKTSMYRSVSDAQIYEILKKLLPKGKSREWYSALMDYGAHLKHTGVSHNSLSKKYVKQSKFVGSLREARGAILRELVGGTAALTTLVNVLGAKRRGQVTSALRALVTEGLVRRNKTFFSLPN